MSAPLELNSEQLRDLAAVLEGLSELRARRSVDFAPYGTSQIGVGDATLTFSWDDEAGEYRITDRVGG